MKKNSPLLSLGILFLAFLWFWGPRSYVLRDSIPPLLKPLKPDTLSQSEALVLNQSPNTPYDTLLAALGREDGIAPGFKAVAYHGIFLGEVLESSNGTSLIKLISFPKFQNEAWLERLGLNVTLEGQGGANLHFFLPKGVKVEVGDRVLSNTKPVFLIGQVELIKEKPGEPLMEIILRLPLNLRNLRYVELIP